MSRIVGYFEQHTVLVGPEVGDGNASSTDRFFVFWCVGLVGEFVTSTPLFDLLRVFAKRPLGVLKLSKERPSSSSRSLPRISVFSSASTFCISKNLSLSSYFFSLNSRVCLLTLESKDSFILLLGKPFLALGELVASIMSSGPSKDITGQDPYKAGNVRCV